jgi:hypothetical protein
MRKFTDRCLIGAGLHVLLESRVDEADLLGKLRRRRKQGAGIPAGAFRRARHDPDRRIEAGDGARASAGGGDEVDTADLCIFDRWIIFIRLRRWLGHVEFPPQFYCGH